MSISIFLFIYLSSISPSYLYLSIFLSRSMNVYEREKINIKWILLNKTYWWFRRHDTSDLLYSLTWTNLLGDYVFFKILDRDDWQKETYQSKTCDCIISPSAELPVRDMQHIEAKNNSGGNAGFVFVFPKNKMSTGQQA